jgi:N-acetylneuraminate 9-O-acetyltransferase
MTVASAGSVAGVTTMASAMMFGTIIFATVALATRAFFMGDTKLFEMAANPRASALDVKSLPSVYTLLFHFSIFGLILFYAYICEYHPPYPHADKNYDADQFFFLTFLLLVVSFFTWKKHDHSDSKKAMMMKAKASTSDDLDGDEAPAGADSAHNGQRAVAEANDDTEILNRDQTEEWKGWMQFMFLLYHYYHAEEVYNSIRIMITCYVWMTGFGNFSFFYLKADYGAIRVLQMLWRLNFLVAFLCLTQGTTYILYYICILHTYYFGMVYVTMRIGHEKNYSMWWIRIKLVLLAVIIFLVWDCDLGLFKFLHYPFFGESPKQGATGGSMWEWYFRSSLDHWSTYLGMIFALNFPITSLFFRKLEAQPFIWHVLGKGAVGAALFGLFYAWVTGPFSQEKFDYNQTNAYFGFVPLIAYIYFRNINPWLRNHTLELLHQIGKTTLETYLMQHHIWLTSDAKSLLTLVPGWPKVNFLLVSLIYVVFSRRLYQLTLFLRGMILPDNLDACLKNLSGMTVVVAFYWIIALILDAEGIMSLRAAGIIVVASGYLLFQYLVEVVTVPTVPTEGEPALRPAGTAIATPFLLGGVVVLVCGLGWETMALHGASKILPLPATCQAHANRGEWVVLSGCDEGPRSEAYRKLGISTVSTCSSQNKVKVWGWEDTTSASRCRFKQRDPKSLKTHLKSRTIYFIGDSITRYLYHSFCRQLGLPDAGAYNALEGKHQNIANQIGDINVDFIWAGFAPELVEGVQNVTQLPTHPPAGGKKRPDLVVLGGGAWDKLWQFSTDEERQTMKNAYHDLVAKMRELEDRGIPIVWLTPTTINSVALPSEEKQNNINESEMEIIRRMQLDEGVLNAATFVIDGPSFTSSRVSESFDGVHYPHNVYSAGAQILANSADWLLPDPIVADPKPPNQPGAMAHVQLGLMIILVALFAIFGFDGFMGLSYLAAIFVPSVAPARLYHEAFSDLHRRKRLPAIELKEHIVQRVPSASHDFGDEEIAGLIDNKSS